MAGFNPITEVIFEKVGPHIGRLLPAMHLSVPLQNGLGAFLVLGCTIWLAHLSYRYFERPFLRLKERFTFVTGRRETAE
jgi:peptidoglycan/LPS O-acetylase OafA/YrhL